MSIPGSRRILAPRSWSPPRAARRDATGALTAARWVPSGGEAPEDVKFDGAGRAVLGLAGGDVVRIDPATGAREVLGNTGGRPLGLDLCADGSILVADHDRGLVRLDAGGRVTVLVDHLAGRRIRFASNVAHRADGTIWFTVSTTRWDLEHYLGDIIEHSRTGQLARRDPDGTVTLLREDLAFANGVVHLGAEASGRPGGAVYVAETGGYRIVRLDLATGGTTALVDDLPGFPDNMSVGSDGLLWVAIAAPRDPMLDRLMPLPGVLRQLVWNLPDALRPSPKPVAWAMALDPRDGRVVHDLRDATLGSGFVTGVAEHDGTLALVGLQEPDLLVAAVG